MLDTELLYGLLYRSQATTPLRFQTLRDLVMKARENNTATDITGILFYTEPSVETPGMFSQWLEGPKDAVRALYAGIQNDPRHTNVELIEHGRIVDLIGRDERLFPLWTMRYEPTGEIPTTLEQLLVDWLSNEMPSSADGESS
ncbi:MAG: BLUF domain-containing protein [Bacteroidota bacterium]